MNKILSFACCITLTLSTYQATHATKQSTKSALPKNILGFLLGPLGYGVVAAVDAYLQANGGQFLAGNKSWQIHKPGTITETFSSIAGNDAAKESLQDLVTYLKDPTTFHLMGAAIPKGVLLEGPPGTGKTLLARALAGEANCNFVAVSGSEFVEMYVGVGAARIRTLFNAVRALNEPCIIFIDEIDALIHRRSSYESGGTQERDQTLNEFLKQVDGFEQHPHPLIIIGATNRTDTADPAALRPGRFDRIVYVGLPTMQDREAILALHIQKTPYADTINLKAIAQRTPGFSGADLAHLVNEAAIVAIHNERTLIEQTDLEAALDTIIMGHPNRTLQITPEEKRITAYHEAGHALVHILLHGKNAALHKVSIISRGRTGGHTAFLDTEKACYSKEYFLAEIAVCLGGRAAEQLICNTIMTGPSNDIYHATHIARMMVCTYGMSEKIGPVAYHYEPCIAHAPHAQSTLSALDQEIKTLLESGYQRALKLLTEHKAKLDIIAAALLEKEELSAQELCALIGMP